MKGQMMKEKPITTLFLDVGDVLLTNGFEHQARALAAKTFDLDLDEMNLRHELVFSTYELGKIGMEQYLNLVVFYKKRNFTRSQFRQFIFAQSQPFPEMIELVSKLKAKYRLKIAVVSNESREVNAFRIRKFKLERFVDFFISSCFVHLSKPDVDIFRLALDISQTPAKQVVYIENTPLFIEVAEDLGIHGILNTDYNSTLAKLAAFGLILDQGGTHELV